MLPKEMSVVRRQSYSYLFTAGVVVALGVQVLPLPLPLPLPPGTGIDGGWLHVFGCGALMYIYMSTRCRLAGWLARLWSRGAARLWLLILVGGEGLQALVPWRGAEVADLAANATGALLGVLVWLALRPTVTSQVAAVGLRRGNGVR